MIIEALQSYLLMSSFDAELHSFLSVIHLDFYTNNLPFCLQTDYDHGRAWGSYKLYGRVRDSDGFIILLRFPVSDHVLFVFRFAISSPCSRCLLHIIIFSAPFLVPHQRLLYLVNGLTSRSFFSSGLGKPTSLFCHLTITRVLLLHLLSFPPSPFVWLSMSGLMLLSVNRMNLIHAAQELLSFAAVSGLFTNVPASAPGVTVSSHSLILCYRYPFKSKFRW